MLFTLKYANFLSSRVFPAQHAPNYFYPIEFTMQNNATQITQNGLTAIAQAADQQALELVKAQYLG
ncbi:hypothetical protein QG058_02195, partial [Kingella kingae]|nr:hypothetical protein [Kingella kingae]